jgi:hypothetical protein
MFKRGGLSARTILAAIGGLAALVAGVNRHYYADHSTPKRKKHNSRGRLKAGTYGLNLRAHFDTVGIIWTAKRQPVYKSKNYRSHRFS